MTMSARRVHRYPGLYREQIPSGEWRFRIVISHHREIIQKYFYFHDEASEARALARAKAAWTEIRKEIPVITRCWNAQIERRKSHTGIVGVRRVTKTTKGHPYDFWIAVWSDRRGRHHSKSFSVHKYGEAEAKALAIKARKDALATCE